MEPLVSPYADRFPGWIGTLCRGVDYLWFFALLGWCVLIIAWWQRPTGRERGWLSWLPWTAGTGAAIAALVILRQGQVIRPTTHFQFAVLGLTTLALLGWWWCLWRDHRKHSRWLFVLFAILLVALASLGRIRGFTTSCAWTLATLAIAAAVPQWRTLLPAWDRVVLTCAALLPATAASGPLALAWTPRNPTDPVYLGLSTIAALHHLVTVAVTLIAWTRRTGGSSFAVTVRTLWREARLFIAVGACWLFAGVVAAALLARERHIVNVNGWIERMRVIVPRFDADGVENALRFAEPANSAPSAITGALTNLVREYLPRIAWASMTTLREEWVVTVWSTRGLRPEQRSSADALRRRARAQDIEAWKSRTVQADGPRITHDGALLFVRAPLAARDGAMLGWLEFAVHAPAGQFSARVAPLFSAALGVVVTLLAYVHERGARARENAVRAAAVAAEANRIRTSALARVSRELHGPLARIMVRVSRLRQEFREPSAAARVDAMLQHGALLQRLFADLTELNATENGTFRLAVRPVAIGDVIRESVEFLRPHAVAKALRLEVDIADEVPSRLFTDPDRVRQIVLNLTGNAIKFTDQGRIDVAVRFRAQRDTEGEIELEVRDTGPGISAAEQTKLFQPFSRLDLTAKKEGSGLGLALVAALCRAAGGRVEVESGGKNGSCFRCRLPVTIAAASHEHPAPRASLLDLGAKAEGVPAPPSARVRPRRTTLQIRLEQMFRADVKCQISAVLEARAGGDWRALRARAHYLKSSAGVVGDEHLYMACAALEDAAERAEPAAVDAAWRECELALGTWLAGGRR